MRARRPRSILEFGTYLGLGTLTMALNAPDDCRIVTVDLPDDAVIDDGHSLNEADLELVRRRRNRTGEAFAGTRVAHLITQVRADSLTWSPSTDLGHFDLVLVDGGHSTPVVRADTDNARRLLAPGGTIVWDDYFHLYPDVVAFLDGSGRRRPAPPRYPGHQPRRLHRRTAGSGRSGRSAKGRRRRRGRRRGSIPPRAIPRRQHGEGIRRRWGPTPSGSPLPGRRVWLPR